MLPSFDKKARPGKVRTRGDVTVVGAERLLYKDKHGGGAYAYAQSARGGLRELGFGRMHARTSPNTGSVKMWRPGMMLGSAAESSLHEHARTHRVVRKRDFIKYVWRPLGACISMSTNTDAKLRASHQDPG